MVTHGRKFTSLGPQKLLRRSDLRKKLRNEEQEEQEVRPFERPNNLVKHHTLFAYCTSWHVMISWSSWSPVAFPLYLVSI